MEIFGRKNKEETPDKVNKDRRKLLKRAGILTAGLATAGIPGIAFAGSQPIRPGQGPFPWDSRQIREFESNKTPLGYIHSGDPAIPQIWVLGKTRWVDQYSQPGNKIAVWSLGDNPRGNATPFRVHEDTPYQEPAFYMLANTFGATGTTDFNRLRRENLPLWHFTSGLGAYFRRWQGRGRRNENSRYETTIETDFMKSLLVAAERPETEAVAYKNMNEGEKERFLTGLKDSISHCGYNCQLVAAWSSFMLANHHWVKSRSKNDEDYREMKRVNEVVEKPLREIYADARLTIRGENKYLNNSV